jgi:arginase
MTRPLDVIGIACGVGGRDPGSARGPAAFRYYAEREHAPCGAAFVWHEMPAGLCATDIPALEAVASVARWSADMTRDVVAEGRTFLAVGGDHSHAIGVWSGAGRGLRRSGPLGLIWIDAHMDMHTPKTTHTGLIYGMPVAALLGHGAPELTGVAGGVPALQPHHVCLVGARSFEPEEPAFARRHGVRVIGMDEVRTRGLAACLAEAKAIVTRGTAGYGISLDLDAFDPADAPGVGTPAAEGIAAAAFLREWGALACDPKCAGVEIAEYNPARDDSGKTLRLMGDLVAAFAAQESIRWAG